MMGFWGGSSLWRQRHEPGEGMHVLHVVKGLVHSLRLTTRPPPRRRLLAPSNQHVENLYDVAWQQEDLHGQYAGAGRGRPATFLILSRGKEEEARASARGGRALSICVLFLSLKSSWCKDRGNHSGTPAEGTLSARSGRPATGEARRPGPCHGGTRGNTSLGF